MGWLSGKKSGSSGSAERAQTAMKVAKERRREAAKVVKQDKKRK